MNEYGIDRIQRGNTQLATWIDEGETILIKRDDQPIAVVVPAEEYDAMVARLRDPMADLAGGDAT